jgi:hypothetical protein
MPTPLRPFVRRPPALVLCAVVLAGALFGRVAAVRAEVTAEGVLRSIERGRAFLLSQQHADGSWSVPGDSRFRIGVTSLSLLALINSGMTAADPPIKKGLDWLRDVREPQPDFTYDIALMLMAFQAADDGERDMLRMQQLARKLEESQTTEGVNRGSWGYTHSKKYHADWTGDRSNAQYAILGLHAAAEAGIPVEKTVWLRARQHWIDSLNRDGGWGYAEQGNLLDSTGSMTVAGIASLAITDAMLRDPSKDQTANGEPNCCGAGQKNDALDRGAQWLADNFAVGRNPATNSRNDNGYLLYYLYGLERAGRLSARRFFGNHDWYRRGAEYLVGTQRASTGEWKGIGHMEQEPVIGTSFALLFLSKGLAPVLMQKCMFGTPDGRQGVVGDNWNHHRWDARRLVERISGMPKWPQLVTWQVLDLNKARAANSTEQLRQAPVLYISGADAHQFTDLDAALLRSYVDQGGFILGVANCPEKHANAFEASFRELVQKMYPQGDVTLEPLPEEHIVWRSEYLIPPSRFDLLGADVGCRTSIIFSRDDLSCLWDKLTEPTPKQWSPKLAKMVEEAFQMGVNVIAYATGREPPNKLEANDDDLLAGTQDEIERGLLQVAKLKHTGGWDVAPRALRNLLTGLNRTVGEAATTKTREINPADENLFKYPLVYMHGRSRFELSEQQIEQLRTHLERGGVLFADACCGSLPFDESFRAMVRELFPEQRLSRIPIDHEIFSERTFYDIRQVRRRMPEVRAADEPLEIASRTVEPFLEGIEIDGRLAVIYSRYDISCALERQVSVACPGYVPEDALKIGINIIMHALLQNASYMERAETVE